MLFVIILSIAFGICLTLLAQIFLFHRWFNALPIILSNWKPQTEPYTLPKEIQDALKEASFKSDKESCKGLNLLLQFLFQELKDAKHVRRWVMKRLKVEFAEMLQSTTGKLLDQIRVRDFNLGRTFPIIRQATVHNVSVNEDSMIEEVTLLLDLTYNGRFQLAVDVDMVFGKSAYLSVTITKLQGTARLQFTRIPFTHWSFTFVEDPTLEFDVESQFEGRPIAQLASIVVNQIRKLVRKKHTFPNYKIRYRPFFVLPVNEIAPQDVFYQGVKLTVGHLRVIVVGCTRLIQTTPDSNIYCSVALDTLPWTELMSFRRKLWVSYDLEIIKTSPQIGMTFDEEFLLDKYEVTVTSVTVGSPAAKANIQKKDILTAVNGIKITNNKQALRLIKQAGDKFVLRIERSVTGPHAVHTKTNSSNIDDDNKGTNNDLGLQSSEFDFGEDFSDSSSICLDQDRISYDTRSLVNMSEFSSKQQTSSPPMPRKGMPQIPAIFKRQRINKPDPGKQNKETVDNSQEKILGSSEGRGLIGRVGWKQETDSDVSSQCPVDDDPQNRKKSDTPSDTQNISSEKMAPNKQTSESVHSKSHDSGELKKTRPAKSCPNPAFNEKFDFEVENKHGYLNVCVWCNQPEKLDKQSRVIKPEREILLGHISIPLMDIALECTTTMQGDFTSSFSLMPSESKVGTGRSEHSSLANHSGFEDRLCYGDILLRFHYSREGKANQIIDESKLVKDVKLEEKGSDQHNRSRSLASGQHQFNPVHFQTATYCHFCSKKIWFKSAFQCSSCRMVCHKKCTEKCQRQANCGSNDYGLPAVRLPGANSGMKSNGVANGEIKEADQTDVASSFEGNGDRKRHSSAPDENVLETEDQINLNCLTASSAASTTLPRTRSSNSLQDITAENGITMETKVSKEKKLVNDNKLFRLFSKQQQSQDNSDEQIVLAAKRVGRQLYHDLELEARKEKFDDVINKLGVEIANEAENQKDLVSKEGRPIDRKQRSILKNKIEKSKAKLESMNVLMLQYCAGLQHCMDEEENERQKKMKESSDAVQQTPDVAAAAADDVCLPENIDRESPTVGVVDTTWKDVDLVDSNATMEEQVIKTLEQFITSVASSCDSLNQTELGELDTASAESFSLHSAGVAGKLCNQEPIGIPSAEDENHHSREVTVGLIESIADVNNITNATNDVEDSDSTKVSSVSDSNDIFTMSNKQDDLTSAS